jgi:hypothetical protein
MESGTSHMVLPLLEYSATRIKHTHTQELEACVLVSYVPRIFYAGVPQYQEKKAVRPFPD